MPRKPLLRASPNSWERRSSKQAPQKQVLRSRACGALAQDDKRPRVCLERVGKEGGRGDRPFCFSLSLSLSLSLSISLSLSLSLLTSMSKPVILSDARERAERRTCVLGSCDASPDHERA